MQKFKKIFKGLLVVLAVLTVVSQLLLLNDNIKKKLSAVYSIESKYVYSEKNIPKGSIQLEISNPSDALYLLQNGEKIMQLDKKSVTVNIFDNSVIEIDGRNTDISNRINISNISENISGFYNEKIEINKDIVILGRFFIK